jgi:hypothetical protein
MLEDNEMKEKTKKLTNWFHKFSRPCRRISIPRRMDQFFSPFKLEKRRLLVGQYFPAEIQNVPGSPDTIVFGPYLIANL